MTTLNRPEVRRAAKARLALSTQAGAAALDGLSASVQTWHAQCARDGCDGHRFHCFPNALSLRVLRPAVSKGRE